MKRNTNSRFCIICTEYLFPFNYDDNDYDQVIYDDNNMYSCKKFIQELRNKAFVPRDLNEDTRTFLVASDQNTQYFGGAVSNNLNSCYYSCYY